MKKTVCVILMFLIFFMSFPERIFAEESSEPEPYSKDEFPQWSLDLRRFEIVSLGSIPFAMIGVTLAYGAIEVHKGNMSSIPNPLNPSSLDESEQMKILGLTVCTGIAIGLVDHAVNLMIRHNNRKRQERINAARQVNVIPLEDKEDSEIIENEVQPVEPEDSEL